MQVYFELRHENTVQSSNGSNHIVPVQWTHRRDDDTPQLSHNCGSYGEFSAVIDAMIADLENLRVEGKRRFERLQRSPETPPDFK
jgi:hypothetical protein